MENQFKGIERSKEYGKGKSSSSVFTEAHEADFLAGYNKALEDCCANEMLEMLKKFNGMNVIAKSHLPEQWFDELKSLIHSATTLLTVLFVVVIVH